MDSEYPSPLLRPLPASIQHKRGSFYDPYDSSILIRSKLAHSYQLNPDLKPQQGLSMTGAALAYIATIIGAGIGSLPYAMQAGGYEFGIAVHVMMIGILLLSVVLLLKTKDNLGYE